MRLGIAEPTDKEAKLRKLPAAANGAVQAPVSTAANDVAQVAAVGKAVAQQAPTVDAATQPAVEAVQQAPTVNAAAQTAGVVGSMSSGNDDGWCGLEVGLRGRMTK